MTLGPGGMVAHPVIKTATLNITTHFPRSMFTDSFFGKGVGNKHRGAPFSPPVLVWRNCLRHHFHPPARACPHVGVIAAGVLTVVPVIGFFRLRLAHVDRRLLNDHCGRRVVWIRRSHHHGRPPVGPGAPRRRPIITRPPYPYIESKEIARVTVPGQPGPGQGEEQHDCDQNHPNNLFPLS